MLLLAILDILAAHERSASALFLDTFGMLLSMWMYAWSLIIVQSVDGWAATKKFFVLFSAAIDSCSFVFLGYRCGPPL